MQILFIFHFLLFFFVKLRFAIKESLFSWCRLWRAAFLFIIYFIFSFFTRRLSILHITGCLLKTWASILFPSRATHLILITIFLSWVCSLNTILMSLYCRSTIITKQILFFYRSRTNRWLLQQLFVFKHLLCQPESFIHSSTYTYNRWTYQWNHFRTIL